MLMTKVFDMACIQFIPSSDVCLFFLYKKVEERISSARIKKKMQSEENRKIIFISTNKNKS